MRYYFVLGRETAAAETPEAAERLRARGYIDCTHARWRTVADARDGQRQAELRPKERAVGWPEVLP